MAQADQIAFTVAKKTIQERSSLTIGANFRLRSTAAAVTPTNVYYRLDDLATGAPLLGMTSVAPASGVNITVTPDQNAIRSDFNALESKQLTVIADYGLATQYVDSVIYQVRNLQGLT